MRFSARNWIVTVATVSFVTTVTGVSLQLHLLGRDHQGEHNSRNCSLCQHFIGGCAKFTQEPESELPAPRLRQDASRSALHVPAAASHHEPFAPRAPPAA